MGDQGLGALRGERQPMAGDQERLRGAAALALDPEAQRSAAVGEGTGIPGRSAGYLSTVMLGTNCPECQGIRAGPARHAHTPRWRRGWPRPLGAALRPLLLRGSGWPASPVLAAGKEDRPARLWSWKPLSRPGGVTVHRPRGRDCWCARSPVKAQGSHALTRPGPWLWGRLRPRLCAQPSPAFSLFLNHITAVRCSCDA